MGRPFALSERLVRETPALLQAASGHDTEAPDGDGWFEIDLTAHVAGSVQHRPVRVRLEQAVPYPLGLRVPFRWVASDSPVLFPTFEGALEIEDADINRVTVALVGHYRPPGGLLGRAIDRSVLATVAEESVERLLTGLVQQLSANAPSRELPTGAAAQLSVADVMSRDPILVDASMSLRAAANLLLQRHISGAPVIDAEGRMVGAISESDLLDKVAPIRHGISQSTVDSWRHHAATTVGMACTRPAHTTQSSTPLREAAGIMAKARIRRLVVLEGSALIGILTVRDVIKALLREDDEMASAVDSIFTDGPYKGLRAQVTDGVVEVTGVVQLRSTLVGLREALHGIDGVVGVVDSGVDYNVDDLGAVGRSDGDVELHTG